MATTTDISAHPQDNEPGSVIAAAILDFVGHIPESRQQPSLHPAAQARLLARGASRKAALTAGSLALPPGPLGWLTLLPELIAVWRLQTQMVADIAALFGKQAELTREQMLYCLFRHTAAQVVRDLAVRVGERYLIRKLSVHALQRVTRRVGIRITRQAIGKGVSRWLPVVGAIGVGAYAYYDTGQVARTAIEMFTHQIDVDGEASEVAEGVGDQIPPLRLSHDPGSRE